MPTTFCWDSEDGRLLVCETRRVQQTNEKRPPTSMSTMRGISVQEQKTKSPNHSIASTSEHVSETQAIVLFVTNDSKCEIKEMETINLKNGEQLVNMCTPFVVSS